MENNTMNPIIKTEEDIKPLVENNKDASQELAKKQAQTPDGGLDVGNKPPVETPEEKQIKEEVAKKSIWAKIGNVFKGEVTDKNRDKKIANLKPVLQKAYRKHLEEKGSVVGDKFLLAAEKWENPIFIKETGEFVSSSNRTIQEADDNKYVVPPKDLEERLSKNPLLASALKEAKARGKEDEFKKIFAKYGNALWDDKNKKYVPKGEGFIVG